mgnify:CR=1 FL=1
MPEDRERAEDPFEEPPAPRELREGPAERRLDEPASDRPPLRRLGATRLGGLLRLGAALDRLGARRGLDPAEGRSGLEREGPYRGALRCRGEDGR